MDERRALGRAARDRVPLPSLADWDPAQRGHDALGTVLAQNETRVPDLVPIRMSRMSASPWTYYRGAAAVLAADLAAAPHTGIDVQLCGDAHVLNFGLWATPERQLSFDLRDFDETRRGPFEWDVKRYLASLVVLARDTGLPEKAGVAAVRAALRAYRDRIAFYSTADELTIWYDVITADRLLELFGPEEQEQQSARLARRARRRTSAGAARKLTRVVDGQLRIVDDPPTRVRLPEAGLAAETVQAYRDSLPYERRGLLDRFTLVDVVRQVVGVGSVGMQVYLVLLLGRNGTEPLFLQIKQAGPSVYEQHLGPSPYPSHGERVIRGKRHIQAASDIFLGWTSVRGLDFYVRQFRDMKVIPSAELIAPVLVPFAERCAHVLARSHARTGDAMAIAGYLGKGKRFDEAMAQFAVAYADQTIRDHRELLHAVGLPSAGPGTAPVT
ncbi:DUF2252 domain-containing protein [Actinoplanes sp. KI2]|uniref:DUF2252 domain-containing protein n=1 Tax=Actinoplanes sp. KI2 TaxID=2983315 RepID=UPI0021D5CFBF|nr:DUF2252 domain-containing protein [Actinoplanes sp. KI2]MCU7724341.1 DUF2252 domain-containing protein [Actinoplanes sp. KI2]